MTGRPAAGWWRWRTRARRRDGWDSPHTAVDVVTDDAPFLVDSVSAALARRGYDLHLLLHPLLERARRRLTSHLHLEIDRETDLEVLDRARRRDRGRRRRRVRGGRRLGRAARSGRPTSPARCAATARPTGSAATRRRGRRVPRLAGRRPLHVRRRDAESTSTGPSCPAPSSGWRAGARCSSSTTPIRRRRLLLALDQVAGALHRPPRRAPRLGDRAPPRADGTTGGELRLLGLYTANVFSDSRRARSRCCAARSRRSWPARVRARRATTVAR